MKRYSEERKASVIQRMIPPHNTPIPDLVAETGISDVTLYTWRKQARVEGIAVPADGKNPEKWSSADKFAIVLEAASLNENLPDWLAWLFWILRNEVRIT